MTAADPLATLNPSIVGQAEKAHNAVLDRVLAGTSLDERQWITLQLASAAGAGTSVSDLVARVSAAAKFSPAVVEAAIEALTGAALLDRSADDKVTVTAAGTALVGQLRAKAAEFIGRAYGQIPAEDLAIAARVLATITATLSEDLARSDAG
jgi:hypothetical protein